MLPVAQRVKGLLEAQGKRWATCWTLTRTDGGIVRLTTADRNLTFQGQTYAATGSFRPSARRRDGSLRDSNVDVRGALVSSAISSSDLMAGRYRDCLVDESRVDWRFPLAGAITTFRWWIGKTTFDGETWTANLENWTRWLRPRFGDVFTRTCRATLGDAQCGVNLASFTVSGAVVDGCIDGERRRVIRATTAAGMSGFADGYFANGLLTFSTGANAGIPSDVKDWTQATREIALQNALPFAIAPGDTFSIVAGCDKLKGTCGSKFSNTINYRGFPYIPGTDAVLRIRPA